MVRLSPGGTKHVKNCENVKLKYCPCTSVKNIALRLLQVEPSTGYQFEIQILEVSRVTEFTLQLIPVFYY